MALDGKKSICQCRKHRRIEFDPWARKIPGVGNGNPLQYSCLENSMGSKAWQFTVHGTTKSQTWRSNWALHSPTHKYLVLISTSCFWFFMCLICSMFIIQFSCLFLRSDSLFSFYFYFFFHLSVWNCHNQYCF